MAQLSSLSSQIETLSHVLGLVEAFRAFDGDNDGFINSAELGGVLGSLGYNPSDEEVNSMMREGDTNRDGLLSIEEFLEMNTKDLGLGDLGNFLKCAFEDLDGEAVRGEELFEVMQNMAVGGFSIEDCQNIIASMDGDGDGVVNFEDFKLILNSLL